MAEYGDNTPDDKLQHEAEEMMRQRRFRDAARRYQDLHRGSPTDLWAALGFASALECAGELEVAERVLEETAKRHGASASMHRFRHLFFTRREDLGRASSSQKALRGGAIEAGESDQLADLYFNQGRYHEALAEIERRLHDSEADPAERAGLMARAGACMRQSGDPEAARDRLLGALGLEPEHPWILAELAEAERSLGMPEAAREHYLAALTRSPDDHWTRGHLAQLENEDGKPERAIALYEEILRAEPKAVWAKVELAQVLADKDVNRSVELCTSALADDPDYPWAHAHLGLLARKAGRFAEAMQSYQRANRAAPEALWVLHEACETARSAGREDLAEQALERARAIDPYDATTHGYIADLRRHQNRLRDSLTHLEQAVQRDPDYLWAWRELAEVRALLGEHAAAEEAYRHARDLAPEDSVSDGLYAFLFKHRGERDRGIPWLERAAERQPDYLWAWRELAELHLVADRPAEAERAARRGLEKCPDAAPLHGILAESLRRQGHLPEAVRVVTKALELAPQAAQLWALRAELAAASEDASNAIEAAARAVSLDQAPEFAALHAQALLAAGRDTEAEIALVRALKATEPPAVAFELAAILAERRQDLAAAIAHLDRAIAIGGVDEPRRLVRRARLLVQSGDRAAAAVVLPLLAREDGVPWGELAATLALAGQAEPARRAAWRHAAHLPPLQAWIHQAEIALHLGDRPAADQAVQAALAVVPDDAQARTLASVVAEGHGDLPTALTHLGVALAARPSDRSLLRQTALLHERMGHRSEALAGWRAFAACAAPDDGRNAELAAALHRLHEDAEAAQLTPAALAGPATPERQRLWRDRAMAAVRRGGPGAGVAALDGRDDLLGFPGRILAVQLALGAGNLAAARTQLEAAEAHDEQTRKVHAVLMARLLIAEGRAQAGLEAARAAALLAPGDEDPLIAAADALLVLGRFREALLELDGGPTGPWPPERAAICGLIALALDGQAAATARLLRCPDPGAHPLGRILAVALPGSAPAVAARATAEDVGALGPRLAQPLVTALAAAGRPELAAAMLLACADAAQRRHDLAAAAIARRQAIPHLRRAVGRRAAAAIAWRYRDLPGVVRALLW